MSLRPRAPAPQLDVPAGIDPADVGIGSWQPGLTFGECSERTMSRYYEQQ